MLKLDAHREWLGMGLGAEREAAEPSLQQRHQARVPIANHEKQQERYRNVVLIVERVVHGESEIAADQQLGPRNPSQPAAIFLGPNFILAGLHAIFRCAREWALLAHEGLEYGL